MNKYTSYVIPLYTAIWFSYEQIRENLPWKAPLLVCWILKISPLYEIAPTRPLRVRETHRLSWLGIHHPSDGMLPIHSIPSQMFNTLLKEAQRKVRVFQASSQWQGREDGLQEALQEADWKGALKAESGHVNPLLRALPWFSVAWPPRACKFSGFMFYHSHCFQFSKEAGCKYLPQICAGPAPYSWCTLHSSTYLLIFSVWTGISLHWRALPDLTKAKLEDLLMCP